MFACLSWTLIPIGWALLFAAIPGDVLEMNETLASLGLMAGATGVVTATMGLVIAARAARRRHPGPRGAIAFAIAGNAIALGTILLPFAVVPFQHAHAGLGDLGGPIRRPVADRPAALARKLVEPGTDFVWSGRRRPSAVAWHDGTLVASVGRNDLAAMTADGTELWRRRLLRGFVAGSCVVRGLAVDAAGNAVASCGATVVAVGADGRDRWSRRFDGYLVDGLVADADGHIYVYTEPWTSADLTTTSTPPSVVVALSSTGAVRWRESIDRVGGIARDSDGMEVAITAASPADGGGVVVATESNVVDLAADGSRRWRLWSGEYPVEVNALLAGRDGTIYVAGSADQGFVQAVSADGSPRWTATMGQTVRAIAIGPDGSLYALTFDDLFQFSTS